MRQKTAHVSLRMDPALKARAEKAAAEDQRTLSSLTKALLHNHCKARESDAEARQPAKRSGK